MDTLLIPGSDFANVDEVANWANRLVGRTSPVSSSFEVKKVLHVQVVPVGDKLDALAMVEVERKKSMSSMVLNMRKDLKLSPDRESDQEEGNKEQ